MQKLEEDETTLDSLEHQLRNMQIDEIACHIANLHADLAFEYERVSNENRIGELRLDLRELRLNPDCDSHKADGIVAEMLEREIENLLNGYSWSDILAELGKQLASENSCEEDDEDAIRHFVNAIKGRQGESND
jgi:hypothetical protein